MNDKLKEAIQNNAFVQLLAHNAGLGAAPQVDTAAAPAADSAPAGT